MGTRSTIALEYADGTVGQVYCHWDGYLEHNGEILAKHYMDPFKVRDLIDCGDLSSLAPEVKPEPYTLHDFNEPQKGVCVFYGRDRGEAGVTARTFANFAEYAKNHQHEEYEYILRQVDGKPVWFVLCFDTEEYEPLLQVIERNSIEV
jgi:hypothetical protein